MSVYPDALDSFDNNHDDDPYRLIGPDVDDHADAINKIQVELGLTPSASYKSVASRLDPRTELEVVTAMQSGHGVTLVGGSAVNLNDTSTFALGTQSAKFTTVPAEQTYFEKTEAADFDMTDKQFVFWTKAANWEWEFSEIDFLVGDASLTNYFRFRLVNAALPGGSYIAGGFPDSNGVWQRWTQAWEPEEIVGSPNRAALRRWRFRVKANTSNYSVFSFNGWAMQPEPKQWPYGVVTINFDDGWDTQYTLARPVMDKYGFPATAYIIRDQIGTANHMTLAQLKALQDLNGWQIASHADTQTNHDLGFDDSLSLAAIETEMDGIINYLKANGLIGWSDFAWPGGNHDANGYTAAKRRFQTSRDITGRVTRETLPVIGDLHRVRGISLRNTDTPATLAAWIDRAYSSKSWLNLVFHQVKASPTILLEYSTADFTTVMDYLAAKDIPVRTVADVMRLRG